MVVPRFIEQALNKQAITIYGTGKQSRCFVHVEDVIGALIKLIEEPRAIGEVFNIGSQEEITIEQLAREIIKLTDSKSKIVYIPYEKAYEEGFEDMQRRVPDINKINKLIGFKPTYTLPEIIKDIVECLKDKHS
jgi:UDP-glucose 4-epimerase